MGSRSYRAFIILRRLFWTTFLLIMLDVALILGVVSLQNNSAPGQWESFEPAMFVFAIAWLPMGFLLFFLGIAMLIANGLSSPRSSSPSRDWGTLLKGGALGPIAFSVVMLVLELGFHKGEAPDRMRLIAFSGLFVLFVAQFVFGHVLCKLARHAKLRNASNNCAGVDGESSTEEGIRHVIE